MEYDSSQAKDITLVNPTKQFICTMKQYQDMDIQSGVIVIDYGKDLVYAGRLRFFRILFLNHQF